VVPGATGFLVPPGDPEALAERMLWFIENRDRIPAMGQRGRALAVERFSVERITARMVEILEPAA
jgi:glycosyltransferase involved in cell wall biosynthesis